MTIILASASPRRKELLKKLTTDFIVEPSNVDEGSTYTCPRKMTAEISLRKAQSVSGEAVLAADTTVYLDGKEYGKPKDEEDAKRMLKILSNRWHTVCTGVTLRVKGNYYAFTVLSRVKFKKLSDNVIEDYVSRYKPLDKAGAYGIQDEQIVAKYRGSYSNIMGLPLERTEKLLRAVEKKEGITLLDETAKAEK